MIKENKPMRNQSSSESNDDIHQISSKLTAPRRVGIIINTPGQVHFYKYIYRNLIDHGHNVYIIARDVGDTIPLLCEFDLPHSVFSIPPASKVGKVLSLPRGLLTAVSQLKKSNIDIITGFGVYDAYASALLGVPNVVFCDNEPRIGMRSYEVQFKLFFPFVDSIVTPSFFREDLGEKHIRINGTKELAYLHPNYFHPDDSIFDILGIDRGESYSLLRFNGLGAFHDLGVNGFSLEEKQTLVKELEKYGPVFISSEKGVPPGLENNIIRIPKNKIHDALYFASLFVTDTQTMATEASILGTPTVRCNSFVGKSDMGNFVELEKRYGLLFNFRDSRDAIKKALELINNNVKSEWGLKRECFLKDKIDLTTFMTWFIENYPRSFSEMRTHPEVQYSDSAISGP